MKTQVNELLKQNGLISHTFAYQDLPPELQIELDLERDETDSKAYLTLLANAGGGFWHQLQTELARAADDKLDDLKLKSSLDRSSDNTTLTGKDWFDDRSVEIVRQLLVLTNAKAKVLYPGEVATPLIKLGELAGWSTPSPLGLGVSNTYGPWLAYRALVLTNEPLTPVQNNQPRPTSPCLDCAAPCVDACPGDAVASNSNFNIDKCVSHRALKNSSCAVDCHARNACPVGTEYQYPAQQRAYHMTLALSAMINWTKKS